AVDDLVGEVLGGPWQRRIGPHTTGVRAGVAIAEALEVLGGRERDHLVPVAEAEQGDLRAVQELLDHHTGAPAPVHAAAGVLGARRAAVGDDHSLTGGQAVVLDHVRRAEGVQGVLDRVGGAADPGHGGGHVCGRHDLLGEGLRTLQVGGVRVRSEHGDVRGSYGIGNTDPKGGSGAVTNKTAAWLRASAGTASGFGAVTATVV